jgi:hypothetical protein
MVIGISPKSFGFYYFNDKENNGNDFLKNIPDEEVVKRVKNVILPGSNMNTSWLLSMETIRKNFGSEYSLQVGHKRYRFWQLFESYRKDGRVTLDSAWHIMRLKEKFNFVVIHVTNKFLIKNILRTRFLNLITRFVAPYPSLDLKKRTVTYKNILGVFEKVDPENFE